MMPLTFTGIAVGVVACGWIAHQISYRFLKSRILKSRKWDLNICCGRTDGGGLNLDIVEQHGVPNFKLIGDIYNLPFATGQFDQILCSHTIEHVNDPQRFFTELQRVGHEVVIVIPPLYDFSAVLNLFEHKHIFWSLKKKHSLLPKYTRLPLAAFVQRHMGQMNPTQSSRPLLIELFYSLFSRTHREKPILKMHKTAEPMEENK